jgi:transposase
MQRVRLRELTEEERTALQRLAHSRTAEARLVERARMIWEASQGALAPQIAEHMRLRAFVVRKWIRRFNAQGLPGLEDRPRPGRPPTYSPAEVAEVIAAALTDPRTLKLPFASWTLDRLEAYLNEQKRIAIKRSRIDEILTAEGLRWRKHESWFGERVDPEFAEKRGGSRSSTQRPPQAVSW